LARCSGCFLGAGSGLLVVGRSVLTAVPSGAWFGRRSGIKKIKPPRRQGLTAPHIATS
jgi:hypothetical protein